MIVKKKSKCTYSTFKTINNKITLWCNKYDSIAYHCPTCKKVSHRFRNKNPIVRDDK